MPKTIGVMGGMGPEATAEFYRILVQETPAECDQEHLPTLILSDPRVPDRTDYILGTGQSFLPRIMSMAADLERFGADLIVMPCNTAHLFWQELADSVGLPVLNIIEETVDEIERTLRATNGRIGILATLGTLKSDLYQKALSRRGFAPLIPQDRIQHEVHEAIKCVKAHTEREESRLRIERALQLLFDKGVDGVILGCTELGLAGDLKPKMPVFDSLKILVRATLREATK